ncbi:MAG: hypothetical protein H0Z29_08540 [Candidatus Marinimicrobia bacterium]|nr:hypothetical protein [Candidatus Neomarinimicrobiota bacterium]
MSDQVIKYFIYSVAWLLVAFAGSFFVKTVMRPFKINDLPKGFDSAGKYIGIIERTLIFILLVMGERSLIGFLLTMKAIYRFGDISGDNRTKMRLTEYFLIGTLLSFLWVLVMYLLTLKIVSSIC